MASTLRSSSSAAGELLPIATLHRFRQGEEAAFVEIMEKYQPLVRRAVARHFRSEFEREEAMQEIWLHVFRQRETLDPARGSLSGWLAVLARRRCIDLLRQAKEPAELMDSADESDESPWLESPPEQEAAAESAELMRAVASFRSRLEPRWQRFFDLHFVDGLDYEEIGKRLGIGKLRCKYMRKVLALRARRSKPLMAALGHLADVEKRHAS